MSEAQVSSSGYELWVSRLTFIFAATGSAVGLGNIWKFPYMAGENGGGAFVLIYVLCVLLVGLPIMMAEILIGRRARRNPVAAIRALAIEEGVSSYWRWAAITGVLAGFLILSFYSVIGGWVLAYVFRSAGGLFVNAQADEIKAIFFGLTGDAERLIAWHTLFMATTVVIVARGVKAGLEKAMRYLVPALFVILLSLVAFAATTDEFYTGLRFLFVPDFSALSGGSVLDALGMAFFSLTVGMGAIMMYSAYLPKDRSIVGVALSVVLADLLVALLAGMAIFPLVFANGLESTQGPGLIFNTLPLAFGHMQAGRLIGSLFFLSLLFAALTSAISLLEPSVAWLMDSRQISRPRATVWLGFAAWLLGLGTVFSFNLWVGYEWTLPLDLGKVQIILFENKNFYDAIDFFTSNICLPLAGLLVTLFVARAVRRTSCEEELAMPRQLFNIWYFVLRYLTPIGVLLVFLHVIGLLVV